MSNQNASVTAPENWYKSSSVCVPRLRFARMPLNNLPSGTVVFAPTSVQLLEWRIPASTCMNLSKSYVQCQLPVPALANYYGLSFEDGVLFRTVYFGNGSGLGITDVQFADCWIHTVRPIDTPLIKFLGSDQLDEFYPCRQLNTTNIFPFSLDGLILGTQNASYVPYLEPQHLQISSAANTAMTISRKWPLSSVKRTLLAQNIDLVFGQDMFLRLQTNWLSRLYFYCNTPANPNSGGLGNAISPVTLTSTALNIYLYLAIEENLDIRNTLLSSLARGSMKIPIEYTYCYRFSGTAASASSSVSLTVTKSYGRAIRSIVYVPFNANGETPANGNYAYDHSNVNGTKVNTIITTMDGRPLIDYPVNCVNPNSTINPAGVNWSLPTGQVSFADDYREALKFLEGSAVQSYPQYASQWFYSDAWGMPWGLTKDKYDLHPAQISEGFSLVETGDHVWAMTAQTGALTDATNNCSAAGLINYVFVTFLRTLVIQPDGIILEN